MRPGHDIKLPIQRFLDSTTPSRHDRNKKTDLYESFDSTRTQPPRWLAVCIHTRCDTGPSLQPGLLYTYPGLSTRPTTNDALLSRGWYWYKMADGNSRWTSWLHRLLTLLRVADSGVIYRAGLRTLSTTNTRGHKGLVAWSEE